MTYQYSKYFYEHKLLCDIYSTDQTPRRVGYNKLTCLSQKVIDEDKELPRALLFPPLVIVFRNKSSTREDSYKQALKKGIEAGGNFYAN